MSEDAGVWHLDCKVNGERVEADIDPRLTLLSFLRDQLTIEGIGTEEKLHVLQKHFIASGAVQCGYCTPGLIMAAKALLDRKAEASEEELVTAIEGNICRCTGYESIVRAVGNAYEEMRR